MASAKTTDIPHLGTGFNGESIRPGDARYDEARKLWNGMFDKRPALIARCKSAADVAAAVAFGADADLPLAVRSGGHSIPGHSGCDEGLVIDLSGLTSIEVDPAERIARVGGGVLAGDLDRATQEHGLHTPSGRVTTTGVGGFTTGGGYAWTSPKHGLACDNLVSAEVVTAAGEVVSASAQENPDLFWGIRGGGGNFGVVTRFDFRLHALGPLVLAGLALWPLARAPEVLQQWRDYVEQAPDELSTAAVIMTGAPEPFVPEHLRGQPVLGMAALYVGDPDEGIAVLQPLKVLAPDLDLIQPMPYLDFQAILDPSAPPGQRVYALGEYLNHLSDQAIDAYVEQGGHQVSMSPFTQIIMFRVGAAIARVGADETAVSNREAAYLLHPISVWEDPALDDQLIAGNRALCAAMREFTTGGVYVNFTAERDQVAAAYGEKHDRLARLKETYDPRNVFRLNQNIKPREA
jgi:FAD binding domain-containing protein/berberine-like enzyme